MAFKLNVRVVREKSFWESENFLIEINHNFTFKFLIIKENSLQVASKPINMTGQLKPQNHL